MRASSPVSSLKLRRTPSSPSCTASHFVLARRDATRELLTRARARGEIAGDTDLDVTLDLLYGPIYHRLLHGHAPLTEQFAQQVIDYVIAAISEKGHPRSQ